MKPLLTFGLGAYNQQGFVAEAVAAALSQTYSPLQVILSDDCSTDQTFEIMQEEVRRYRGPHRVVLNRNPTNVGLARHINRIVQLAEGSLIVAASGDDVSLPERTNSLFEAWDSKGRTAKYVYSRMTHIDDAGKPITHPAWHDPTVPTHAALEQKALPSQFIRHLKPAVCGAAGAYAPELYRTFGELPGDVLHEDDAMTLRALLMGGGVLFVDEPLVKYRLHGTNLFNGDQEIATSVQSIRNQEARMQRDFRGRARMYQLFAQDLLKARNLGLVQEPECSRALSLAQRQERLFSLQTDFMAAKTVGRTRTLFRLAMIGVKPALLVKFLIRLLPASWFEYVKVVRGRVRSRAS